MTPAEEFNQLLHHYGDMAYRMAYLLTGGRQSEASDLVQELFIKIWRQWHLPRPTSMRGWMRRVLRNLYIDSARYRLRRPTVSLHDTTTSEVTWEDILPDRHPSPERVAESQDVKTEVERALGRLDEEFRIPVVLCDMEGASYEDIARIMQCPIGTVRSRIHRGRQQLKTLLKKINNTEVLL